MVGGGYIAAEFSHIAAMAGSAVTILQHGDRMLKGFDPDLVGWSTPSTCSMSGTLWGTPPSALPAFACGG